MTAMRRLVVCAASFAVLASCNLLPQPTDTPEIKAASEEMRSIREACRQRRLAGEFKAMAEYEQCGDPAILQAYENAHYPYMDLIRFALAARIAGAEKVDAGEISAEEYDKQREALRGRLADEIDRRNAATRSKSSKDAPAPSAPADEQIDPETASRLTAGLSAFRDVHL
jgi:hypothetical protein